MPEQNTTTVGSSLQDEEYRRILYERQQDCMKQLAANVTPPPGQCIPILLLPHGVVDKINVFQFNRLRWQSSHTVRFSSNLCDKEVQTSRNLFLNGVVFFTTDIGPLR